MNRRIVLIVASLLLLSFLAGYLVWRTSPAQVARRFLERLAETATVYPEHNQLNRRLRGSRISQLLADPLVIRVQDTRFSGSYDTEELVSGYLSVVLDASYFQVTFSKIRLLEANPRLLKAEGRLNIQSDEGHQPLPFDQVVELEIRKIDNLLLLSRVSTRAPAS